LGPGRDQEGEGAWGGVVAIGEAGRPPAPGLRDTRPAVGRAVFGGKRGPQFQRR